MKKINLYKYLINLSLPLAVFAFLFFMIGIINSAKKETLKLEGHWHLTKIKDGDESILGVFSTLDFENDSTAILGKNIGGYGGRAGYHDAKNQRIRIGGECFMAEFSYTIERKQILLKHKQFYEEDDYYIAEKCGFNCCNKQSEYFSYQNIDIDLPITQKATCFQHDYKSLENDYYFGLPKDDLSSIYRSAYQLVLGERFSKAHDIELYIEKHKIKVAENKRNRIYRVIYADKDTPMKVIAPTLDYFKKKGEKRLFFATRQKDMTEELIICLSRIDLETNQWKEALTVEEWLEKTN